MLDRRTFFGSLLALANAPSLAKLAELTRSKRTLTCDEAIRLLEPKLCDIWADAYGPPLCRDKSCDNYGARHAGWHAQYKSFV